MIALPDFVFGACQALAARVDSRMPGDDIPLLLTPRGEVHASVDAVVEDELQTTTGTMRVTRVSLIVLRDEPTPIEIWVSHGMLVKAELPRDGVALVRDDVR